MIIATGKAASIHAVPVEALDRKIPSPKSICILKPRGGLRISRRIIASRKRDVDASNVATSVLRSPALAIVSATAASISAGALKIGGGVIGNDPSSTSKAGGTIFSATLTVRGGGISFVIISRLCDFSRLSCENGEIGGCTGASGRGGIFVRGTTGGGGFEVGGWPRASNNLRIRSSFDSAGARRIGVGVLGVGVDIRFD